MLNTILQWVLFVSLFAFATVVIIYTLKNKDNSDNTSSIYLRENKHSLKIAIDQSLSRLLLKSYVIFIKIPPLRYYVDRCERRLSTLQINDEFELRRMTMKMVYSLLFVSMSGIVLLLFLHPTVSFFIVFLITGVIIQRLMLDTFVQKLERRLLEQMLRFFTEIRYAYHRHGSVEDAIEEAGEAVGQEIGIQANKIYEAITSAKPEEELEKYNEIAPNRFLKVFAGISKLIIEFGDRKRATGSIYLQGIANLTQEVQLDLLRRNKLDYLLKGLHIIALVPMFFMHPVEMWARSNFPLMDFFYLSKLGIVIKIILFLIILLSYILLQKLHIEEHSRYQVGQHKVPWEAKLYKWSWVRQVVDSFIPRANTNQFHITNQLLKETNYHLKLPWFQVRRVLCFVVSMLLSLAVFVGIHEITKKTIIAEAPVGYTMFGKINRQDEAKAAAATRFEAKIIHKVKASRQYSNETVTDLVSNSLNNTNVITATVERIVSKLDRMNSEYLKWWEVIISIAIGACAYYMPYLLLVFRRKMLLMEMRQEVYQLGTILMMLKELERISVEEMLEWMYNYSTIFKSPIQKCLLDYDCDAQLALERLKQDIILEEFQNLVDKLLMSIEKIPIQRAFDDLEGERSYHFEQRQFAYEKSINTKAEIGRIIGFTPMYSLILGYLVIPLIWMSFKQMDVYFTQIQKLS